MRELTRSATSSPSESPGRRTRCCWCWTRPPGRTPSCRRRTSEGDPRHRDHPGQARRHGQGRRRASDQAAAKHAGQVHRPRREATGHRDVRPAAVRGRVVRGEGGVAGDPKHEARNKLRNAKKRNTETTTSSIRAAVVSVISSSGFRIRPGLSGFAGPTARVSDFVVPAKRARSPPASSPAPRLASGRSHTP